MLSLFFFIWFIAANAQEQFAVYFEFNQDMPVHTSQQALQAWMQSNAGATITALHGFADKADKQDYNLALSQRRIEKVMDIIKTGGMLLSENIEIKPFGESVASGNSEQDRKVVLFYIPGSIEKQPKEAVGAVVQLSAEMFTKGNHIVLKGLLFYPDTDFIVQSTSGVLQDLADIMHKNPKLKITIHGHMCCSDKDRTNLSGDRAKKVYKYLTDKGIDKKRMSHKGFGVSKPIHAIPEKNEEQRLANRRVEIEIIEN